MIEPCKYTYRTLPYYVTINHESCFIQKINRLYCVSSAGIVYSLGICLYDDGSINLSLYAYIYLSALSIHVCLFIINKK